MSIISVYLCGGSLNLDSGGGCWISPTINHGFTNDVGLCLTFDPTTDQENNRCYGIMRLQHGLVLSDARLEFTVFGDTGSATLVNFVFRYKMVNPSGGSYDVDLSSGADETEDFNVTMNATEELGAAISQDLTHGNFTDGYDMLWDLCRDGDDGTNDTYADEALVPLSSVFLKLTGN
ncbi:MAG: hypothetical protein ACYTE8_02335 [Planctomycetota bacterium]|jgi:hypothetical protein